MRDGAGTNDSKALTDAIGNLSLSDSCLSVSVLTIPLLLPEWEMERSVPTDSYCSRLTKLNVCHLRRKTELLSLDSTYKAL